MIPLHKSSTYRKFVNERNKVLEELLQKRLIQMDAIMVDLKELLIDIISGHLTKSLSTDVKYLDMRIDPVFELAAERATDITRRLRRSVYALAYAGEAEAIGRATAKPTTIKLSKDQVNKVEQQPLATGGEISDRMRLYFGRLKRKVLDAIQLSLTTGEGIKDTIARVGKALPPTKTLVRPRRSLKPVVRESMREALDYSGANMPRNLGMLMDFGTTGGPDPELTASQAFIEPELWDTIRDEYLATEVPTGRGPTDKVKYKYRYGGVTKIKNRYAWEVERDTVYDFVKAVRQGEQDAARENGYKDFVWIAVIDDRTDKCCIWRDGKTTKEIQKEMKRRSKQERCEDAIVPPAHPNCRCKLAPVTDALPDKPIKDLGDFETWLKK